MSSQVYKVALAGVVVAVLLMMVIAIPVNELKSRPEREAEKKPTCGRTTPCGWAVYSAATRRVDYFMKNVCACPENTKCTQYNDDLSVGAYVYRCVNMTST